jgi:hypothetical protein
MSPVPSLACQPFNLDKLQSLFVTADVPNQRRDSNHRSRESFSHHDAFDTSMLDDWHTRECCFAPKQNRVLDLAARSHSLNVMLGALGAARSGGTGVYW